MSFQARPHFSLCGRQTHLQRQEPVIWHLLIRRAAATAVTVSVPAIKAKVQQMYIIAVTPEVLNVSADVPYAVCHLWLFVHMYNYMKFWKCIATQSGKSLFIWPILSDWQHVAMLERTVEKDDILCSDSSAVCLQRPAGDQSKEEKVWWVSRWTLDGTARQQSNSGLKQEDKGLQQILKPWTTVSLWLKDLDKYATTKP